VKVPIFEVMLDCHRGLLVNFEHCTHMFCEVGEPSFQSNVLLLGRGFPTERYHVFVDQSKHNMQANNHRPAFFVTLSALQ